MEGRLEDYAAVEPPFDVLAPPEQQLPLVLASPHSGIDYPEEFLSVSRLDTVSLRQSEDSFVDEIFATAPEIGVPLLRARFARAYLDPNREPFELDPAMFEDALPPYVNARSPRVQAGLGTIARVVASGEDIYAGKLRFADALKRVDRLYRPYHRALKQLLDATRHRFGYYLLIDCHSMPSNAERSSLRPAADIVLGDGHGAACRRAVVETARRFLQDKGYAVALNTPYAGGFTTLHYGRPGDAGHALQIELNRALYMDERRLTRKPFIKELERDMAELVRTLAAIEPRLLAAA
jgi:N-formylglutamate amidohydrolase